MRDLKHHYCFSHHEHSIETSFRHIYWHGDPHRHKALWGNKTTTNVSLRRCLSVICLQWSAAGHCIEILRISSICLPQKPDGQLCLLFVKRKGEEVRLQWARWLQNCISGLNINNLFYIRTGKLYVRPQFRLISIQAAKILLRNNSWYIIISFFFLPFFFSQSNWLNLKKSISIIKHYFSLLYCSFLYCTL